MSTLANSGDPDEMLHFIRISTVCQVKRSSKKEITTCDPSILYNGPSQVNWTKNPLVNKELRSFKQTELDPICILLKACKWRMCRLVCKSAPLLFSANIYWLYILVIFEFQDFSLSLQLSRSV